MIRRATIWATVAGVVAAAASVTAASSSIEAPAVVLDRAHRLTRSEASSTPEERAVAELVAVVNVERSRRGLPPFSLHPQASEAARAHAADMAARGSMQHTGSDGSDGGIRLRRAGYDWSSWGENIAAGFLDPQTLVDSWMQSPPHRSNLLGDFVHVGVGVVADADGWPYWALLTSTPAG